MRQSGVETPFAKRRLPQRRGPRIKQSLEVYLIYFLFTKYRLFRFHLVNTVIVGVVEIVITLAVDIELL